MALEHESPQYEQRNNNRPFGFGDVYTTHKDADFGDGLWHWVYRTLFGMILKGSSRNWMEYLLPPKKLRTFLVSGVQPLDNGFT